MKQWQTLVMIIILCLVALSGCSLKLPAVPLIPDRQQSGGKQDFLPLRIQGAEAWANGKEMQVRAYARKMTQYWQIRQGPALLGELTLQQLALSNGDLYYFLRYEAVEDGPHQLTIKLPLDLSGSTYRFIHYPHGLNINSSQWSEPQAAADLPVASVFLDQDGQSCFLSYINVYEKEANQVKKEHYQLGRALKPGKREILVELPSKKNHLVEQWGLISKQPLVDWQQESVRDALLVGDLNRVRKWTMEGALDITPDSYYPSSPQSFFINPACYPGQQFMNSSGARFFGDMVLVALYATADQQNQQGYWTVSTRSNWLFSEYGLPAGYYDTRWATQAALLLLRGYERYEEELFLQAAEKYGRFLLDFAQTHHFKTRRGGYLVWDYGHEDKKVPTHVSLNHLLTEMNFLYELYRSTEKIEYLQGAEKLRLGVKDSSRGWPRPEADLWYAYLPDGSYGLQDYPELTLRDLRYSQYLIREIYGSKDADLAYLIRMKSRGLVADQGGRE